MLLEPLSNASQASASIQMLPAPIGGIDENTNLLASKSDRAQRLLNLIAMPDGLHSRSGQTIWAKGLPGSVASMFQLYGDSVFACCSGEIWEIQHNVKTQLSTGHLSDRWQADTLSNPALKVCIAANGIDQPRYYHANGTGACAITGVETNQLMCPVWYANRMFFCKARTQELYYLKPGAYEGPASALPIDGLFQNAAPIIALGVIKGDSRKDSTDMLAAVTAWGEVAVFVGTDPDAAANWSRVGVYSTGYPMGWRPLAQVGGELMLLTTIGLISLPSIIAKSKADQRKLPITQQIYRTFGKWVGHSQHANWQLLETVADKGVIILNWPEASPHLLSNSAWSETSNMEATSWIDTGTVTLRGTKDGGIWQYGTSSHDDGAPIDFLAISHYQRAGGRRLTVNRVRASMKSQPIAYHVGIMTDFKAAPEGFPFTLPPAAGMPAWGFPWDPPQSFTAPAEKEIWEWKLAGGSGTSFASVFAARSTAPLIYRGVDLMERTGGQA